MFTNLIYPRFCLSCKKKGKYICPSCLSRVNFSKRFCPFCRKPSDGGLTHKECKKYTNLDGLVCVFKYEGIIRQVIHQLKYKFAYDIAEELAENMVKSARFEPIFLRIDCLIPIPVTDKRRRWRGFNQTEELGKVVSEKLGVKYLPVLVKKKDTLPQVELDTKERNQNLKGVFSIESGWEEKLKGRRMLIFDDVFTTGSTLFEAAKTLSRAYAEAMFGFTFAG